MGWNMVKAFIRSRGVNFQMWFRVKEGGPNWTGHVIL